jgi:hypothetical protein
VSINEVIYEQVKIPLPYNVADFFIARFGSPFHSYDKSLLAYDLDRRILAAEVKTILKGDFKPIKYNHQSLSPITGEYSTDYCIVVKRTQDITEYHKRCIRLVFDKFYRDYLYIELLQHKGPTMDARIKYVIEKYQMQHHNAFENINQMYKLRRTHIRKYTKHLNPSTLNHTP